MMERNGSSGSPAGQGAGARLHANSSETSFRYIPLTEEEILITYSLSYSGTPDLTITDTFRGLILKIDVFNKVRSGKVYTHSIEQYHKENDITVKSFRVSVFSKEAVDIDDVKNNIQNALMFSRCFKTKGSAEARNMTKERTANMFGRTFERVSDLRALLIDRDMYGYNLLEVCIKAAFVGSYFVPAALFRMWGRAGVNAEFLRYFMHNGFSRLSKGCLLCSICSSSSCQIIFKPAGVWVEVLMDVFKASDHVTSASELISMSHGISGELLDYGHCIAYRPGFSTANRIDLKYARVFRWAYRLYRSLVNGAAPEDLGDTR
jgi:hypothetical protein